MNLCAGKTGGMSNLSTPEYPCPEYPCPEFPLDSHIMLQLDKLANLVSSLDDATANARPDAPGMNSPIVLLRHVCGSAQYWLEHVCLGKPNVRDRKDEFSASGPVVEELNGFLKKRTVIADCLERLRMVDRSAAPAAIPTDKDRWWCASIDGVIVHVFHEVAQHLGHAEITRDVLLAGSGSDTATDSTSLLDAVTAELQAAGHPADFIEPVVSASHGNHTVSDAARPIFHKIRTVDGHELNTRDVVAKGVGGYFAG